MYIMYVDESGDVGIQNSPTDYFILSGVILHESHWMNYFNLLVDFRKKMLTSFGLHLREEIHASDFINKPGNISRIRKNDRLTILRKFTDELSNLADLNIINVVVNKIGKNQNYDVFTNAWQALIQRFENTLLNHNFRGSTNHDDQGIIVCDKTDEKKLTKLIRRMRRYNPIPNDRGDGYRQLEIRFIIEDPVYKDSKDSYFIQAADLVAFLLYQNTVPNAYMRKKSGNNYFLRLRPIICQFASRSDPYGIVRL